MVEELVPALYTVFGAGLRLRVLTSSPVDLRGAERLLSETPEPMIGVSAAGVRQWRRALAECWEALAHDPPDLFIAVSHHAFNLVLAAELKALAGANTRTLMVAPPETWAWTARGWLRAAAPLLRWLASKRQSPLFVLGALLNRGPSTVEFFDAIACLLAPGESEYRRIAARSRSRESLVLRVGHPCARYADRARQDSLADAGRALRDTLAPSPEELLLGLFPGSREEDVRRHLPIMLEAAGRLGDRLADRLKLLVAAAGERRAAQIRMLLAEHPAGRLLGPTPVLVNQAEEVLAAADIGLLCSGTITLQAACLGLPSVVIYDRGWSSARTALLHLLFKSRSAGALTRVPFALPNVLLDEPVFPELTLRECRAERVAAALERLIEDPTRGDTIRMHQRRLLGLLEPPPLADGALGPADTAMERVANLAQRLLSGPCDRSPVD